MIVYVCCSKITLSLSQLSLSAVATVLTNIYAEKSNKYFNSKNYDVTAIAMDQATGEMAVKSPYNQLASFFTNLATQKGKNSTMVLAEDKTSFVP